ncbi:MAG: hypothetical protein ACYTGP_03020 [Planctomycetota bacterium]|jgi:hypothetical protein
MSQFNAPVRRGGGVDVYTGLMFVAFLVLAAGVGLLVMRNMEHSAVGNQPGGPIKLVD